MAKNIRLPEGVFGHFSLPAKTRPPKKGVSWPLTQEFLCEWPENPFLGGFGPQKLIFFDSGAKKLNFLGPESKKLHFFDSGTKKLHFLGPESKKL